MNPNSTPTKQAKSNAGNGHLALDPKALEAAKHSLDDGAVTPHFGPWREDIIKLLNDSLATELVCVMRYKRHHFTAVGLASPALPTSSSSMPTRKWPTPTSWPSASCSWAASPTSIPRR